MNKKKTSSLEDFEVTGRYAMRTLIMAEGRGTVRAIFLSSRIDSSSLPFRLKGNA